MGLLNAERIVHAILRLVDGQSPFVRNSAARAAVR